MGYIDELCKNLDKIVKQQGLKLPILLNASNFENYYHCVKNSFVLKQYAYKGWVDVEPNDVFLDCGACVGNTTLWAQQKGARVISFEPIEITFKTLVHNLKANKLSDEDCYQLAVGERTEDVFFNFCEDKIAVSFDASQEVAFHQKEYVDVNVFEKVPVKCVALDEWLPEHEIKPTFIKMDIEGAELSALKGAQETIKTLKPKLAICLYHSDQDLWRIQEYIHSIVPEYKFFCRENDYGTEFILYAATQPLHS